MENSNPDNYEWRSVDHALAYLARADKIPHRVEGERALLDQIPLNANRVLDLGTGDGRLLALLRLHRPGSERIGLDFSETMLRSAQKRFKEDGHVRIMAHDLNAPLPRSMLGSFDAVVSCFSIHHLTHQRKKALYKEVFDLLGQGGVFCNLDHVASPTIAMHERFFRAIGQDPEKEDRSNRLLDIETQLNWLREIGFSDVDCYWKWLELALMVGFKK